MDLTVVVACVEGREGVGESIECLRRSFGSVAGEIVAVYSEKQGRPPGLVKGTPEIRELPVPGNPLVPSLWGGGLGVARSDVVAFTTSHFRVGGAWVPSLLSGIERGWDGVAGTISLDPDARTVDRAIHLLRYAAYAPPSEEREMQEIPGDNAAYSRASLDLYPEAKDEGFWEVDLHERLRRQGGRLGLTPDAEAQYARSYRFGSFCRHRYRHGRQFGGFRVARGASVGRIVMAAPAVPIVMGWRILRRELASGRFVEAMPAIPALFAFSVAWAIGEAVGAIVGPERRA